MNQTVRYQYGWGDTHPVYQCVKKHLQLLTYIEIYTQHTFDYSLFIHSKIKKNDKIRTFQHIITLVHRACPFLRDNCCRNQEMGAVSVCLCWCVK